MPSLTIDAVDSNLDRVMAFLEENLEVCGCPMRAAMQLQVAVEEIFVNIAHYAYAPNQGMATIILDVAEGTDRVRVTFMDSGMPYDPLAKQDPDVTLSLEERPIGGLGIYMVKKSMDSVSYRYEDGKNIFTIEKKI